jgi:gluconolactonase
MVNLRVTGLIAPCCLFCAGAAAQQARDLSNTPLPAAVLASDAKLQVAASVSFLEGPAVDSAGNVYFSDMATDRILKMDSAGMVTTFRADSGYTNGNTFDSLGRLVSCESRGGSSGGRRRIVRTDMATGKIEVLTDRYQGKRYNSPNDVVVDSKGRIWFTDPRYSTDRSDMEMDVEGLYRIDTSGKVTRVLAQPAVQRPNGLAITPDDHTLYVIDENTPVGGGNRKIWAFDVAADGSVSRQRQVYDFGRGRGGDGMRLDSQGNLWVAAGVASPRTTSFTCPACSGDVPTGVYVISPKGELLGRIPIPQDLLTNLAFGGPEKKTLYVTAGNTVFKISTAVSGYSLYPR